MAPEPSTTAATPDHAPRNRLRRRLAIAAAVVAALVLVGMAALPTLLSTEAARGLLLARIDAVLAPARLEFRSVRFSWFGPTRFEDVALIDAEGDRVVQAPRAGWDRRFGQILFDRPDYGTLRLFDADFDVERRPDGSIDLYDALRPILEGEPASRLRIVIEDGTLRLRSPELAAPIGGRALAVTIERPPAPGAVTWTLTLAAPDATGRFRLDGRLDRWRPGPDGSTPLEISIAAEAWPLDLRPEGAGVALRGRLDTRLTLDREAGAPRLAGAWALDESSLDAAGDLLALGRIEGRGAATLDGEAWRARLELSGTADAAARALADRGSLPLPDGLTGAWAVRADLEPAEGGGLALSGSFALPDLSWPDPEGPGRIEAGPLELTLAGAYRPDADSLILDAIALNSPQAALAASGRVDTLSETPRIDVQGEFRPAWDTLAAWLAENVEPGARLAGSAGPFRYSGPLAFDPDDPLAGFEADLGVQLDALDVYGLRLGPTPLVVRLASGGLTIDPIRASLNGGVLSIDPELVRDDNGWTLRLAPGPALRGAEVNDEVSHRVLAYAAPVLDRATSVGGRISADLTRAEFPLGPDLADRAVVEGVILFDGLTFTPGPLAEDLTALAGMQAQTLHLDDPVLVAIADGQIRQRGLALPVGELTWIEINGDVGFDRSLALVASVPITRAMVLDRPILGDIVEGTRVHVPIGGTLSRPEIDRELFRTALRDLGEDLLGRAAVRGAAELFFRLAQPRPMTRPLIEPDPDAPRRLTPAERREQRRIQREQRRDNRP